MTKFGRKLGMEELARGGVSLSFIQLMVKEEVAVKGPPQIGMDYRCERGRGWQTS